MDKGVYMPYKFAYRKIKLPRKFDRRVKLTDHHKKIIKELYEKGIAIREIARIFKDICR